MVWWIVLLPSNAIVESSSFCKQAVFTEVGLVHECKGKCTLRVKFLRLIYH